MKKKINILCTLGPSSLNPNFLKYIEGKVSLVRLNMSHIKNNELENILKLAKKKDAIKENLHVEFQKDAVNFINETKESNLKLIELISLKD